MSRAVYIEFPKKEEKCVSFEDLEFYSAFIMEDDRSKNGPYCIKISFTRAFKFYSDGSCGVHEVDPSKKVREIELSIARTK